MRLFIALNLPKKLREKIHRTGRPLREAELPVRWVEPDNFHVTLKFLGEVRRERVGDVEAALDRVASATRSFSTELAGFGAFPTVRNPRVIWIGVDATPELRCLKQDLEWSLGDAGFDAETRAFHPHVTLGRVSGRGAGGAFRSLDESMSELSCESEIKVHTLDLMQSRMSRNGPRYTVLASARLSAS